MPRRKRGDEWKTHLTRFLAELREKRGMTFREMARIAGCSTSTVHGWANGALPCESIGHLKQLCEFAGMPLAIPLTGTAEKGQASPDLTSAFSEGTRFDGYARIQIFHRLPHGTLQKKEASDE